VIKDDRGIVGNIKMVKLIDSLIEDGWLRTPRVIEAFQEIKRADFMPDDMKNLAELNEALPIGYGQTISQPLTVAFMLEQLQPEPANKILDIGSGSGWTSALLAYIVSKEELKSKIKNQKSKINGKVIAIEIIPELKKFGEKNVAKYNFIKKGIVEFICADGSKGYPNFAARPEGVRPSSVEVLAEGFDKILASAAAEEIPKAWKEQLKIGGRIVCPVKSSIFLLIKKSEIEFEKIEYPGFAFVPLIQK